MLEVLRIENIGKLYRLGELGANTLREDLHRFWYLLWGREDPLKPLIAQNLRGTMDSRYIWALRDISFSVYKGETLALVGRNGAGKSTLLKIISKVAYPTVGSIYLGGTVASLLEVGTGFHETLSGRDNIYLSGALLGMSRREIKRYYEDIVEFSGVRRFIDTPIRRYSLGMRLRLAFSVAGHLQSDILLLDEILSVGDYYFRTKALAHIRSLAQSNRTIIYVAHQLNTVRRICTRGVLLSSGRVVADDTVNNILDKYMDGGHSSAVHAFDKPLLAAKSKGYVRSLSVLDSQGSLCASPRYDEVWQLKVFFTLNRGLSDFRFLLHILLPSGPLVSASFVERKEILAGNYEVLFRSPALQFGAGTYVLSLYLSSGIERFESLEEKAVIHLLDASQTDTMLVEPTALRPEPLKGDLYATDA